MLLKKSTALEINIYLRFSLQKIDISKFSKIWNFQTMSFYCFLFLAQLQLYSDINGYINYK